MSAFPPLWPTTDHVVADDILALIADRAAEADRRGRPDDDIVDALRATGYLGYPVPVELGGGGGDAVGVCAVQRRLASADAGLAIALNMHVFSVAVMVEHCRRRRDESWILLEAIATQRRVVASAFVEPGLGGNLVAVRFEIGIPLLRDMLEPVAERAIAQNSKVMLRSLGSGVVT